MQYKLDVDKLVKLYGYLSILSVLLLSISSGFLFFVDSRTYQFGPYYVPFVTELRSIYPVGIGLVAMLNIIIVIKVLRGDHSNWAKLLLVNPYSLLLLTNVTKEGVIFLGIALFLYFSNYWLKKIFREGNVLASLAKLPALLLFLPRSIYLALVLSSKYYLFIVGLFVFYVYYWSEQFITRLESRAEYGHVGRDFFVGLCVQDKVSPVDFTTCWLPVFLGIPIHAEVISLNYLIFMAGYFPFLFLLFRFLIKQKLEFYLIFITVAGLHWYIMYHSPSFGAFYRYFHPVMWFISFVIIAKQYNGFRYYKFVVR